MMTVRWLREQMRLGKSIYDLPLRVTFYARVSTEKVEQQGSLENQIQYYTEFIQKNPNWTYIPGYIDEGISGTSTYKRDSFLRMIADAQRGMFDFIITKEILGGVRFPWAGSLPVTDDFPICAGCQGQMAHNKKTNRILYFAGNGAGLMACPVFRLT